jgi:ABC-type cobalamin/Fe3+-siderophores transport system ATPase subunit
MISLKNLTLQRGEKTVIQNFSAEIPAGKITVITGPNGCGKSSLLAAIAGDLKATQGTITIAGRDVAELSISDLSALRSVVSQNHYYWLAFTVREILALGQDASAQSQIDRVLELLGISEIADQSVLTLSGGQSQRVEIARALIRDTDIYLFDEPLAAQDIASQVRIIEVFKSLRDKGKTIVVVAHSQVENLSWCDQIIDNLAN